MVEDEIFRGAPSRENANCQVPNLRKDDQLHTLHTKGPIIEYGAIVGRLYPDLACGKMIRLQQPTVTFHYNRNVDFVSLASVHARIMCSFVSPISTLRKQLEADSRVVCSAFFVLTRPWPHPLLPRFRL